MRVTLDLFSGRPNPFELEPDEADRVHQAIASLPASASPPVEPPGLGFRGWVIQDEALGSVHVYGESVAVRSGHRVDAGRSLERLLVISARRHLGPDAFPEDWIAT